MNVLGEFVGIMTFVWSLGGVMHWYFERFLPANGWSENDPWWVFPGMVTLTILCGFLGIIVGGLVCSVGERDAP